MSKKFLTPIELPADPANPLEAATKQYVDAHAGGGGGLIGEIVMWGPATIPTNWLVCDGSAIPAQYTSLIALYGANLPDLRSRVPIGAGTLAALGSNEGIAENLRTPAHNHSVGTLAGSATGSSHTHDIDSQVGGTTVTGGSGSSVAVANSAYSGHRHGGATLITGSGHTHTVTGSTGASPVNGTNHSMPYQALNFIIRAA